MTGSSEAESPEGPGLHAKWKGVVDSLEAIIPIYEKGSSRISLFSDKAMREEVASFAVGGEKSTPVLDLGAGPGTLSRAVALAGGSPVLADASRKMLSRSPEFDRVQCVFESLPFRPGTFGAAVAGFSLRDAKDLETALTEIRHTVRSGGRFAFCDLGKPPSRVKAAMVGGYIRVAPPLIGFLTGGRAGLKFGSLHDTYKLVLDNRSLCLLLSKHFGEVRMTERQMGASIVVRCTA
ncbi:MAG TPA: methyltransferase domain-containing protein [Nitrososphaerales archaeon]|nr:methyltransferase domain-containing protein [Nitrososphaerales archaeon]